MAIAATLGGKVRAARRARRLTLAGLARRVGISPTRLSEIERGLGARAPLETWIALGIALDRPLAVDLSRPLGRRATPPMPAIWRSRRRSSASPGRPAGPGTFELPTRPTDPRRSTDVGIRDPRTGCGSSRSAGTRSAISARPSAPPTASSTKPAASLAGRPDRDGLGRQSHRHQSRLLARYPHIIDAAFPGSSRALGPALTEGDATPPNEPGLVWFDPHGRLRERRRATIAA